MFGSRGSKIAASYSGRVFRKLAVGFVALVLTQTTLLHAASPRVSFDVVSLIECRDVTSPEFAQVHRREKLIEARIQISALVVGSEADEIAELFYRFESPEKSMRVVDFLPRTTLASGYATNVGIEEKTEQATSFGLNAAGGYGPLSAANGTVSANDKLANCRRYELLPPLETVAASGTLDRGNGVYFKLRPTARNSVEGAQEVVLVLQVPASWRADYATVRCQAFGQPQHVSFTPRETPICGQGSFVVGMYLQGDESAHAIATDFVRAESKLRRIAATERTEVERRAAPTPVHELAIQFAMKSPRIPGNWMEQLLVGPDREAVRFLGYLPSSVRDSAMDYSAARRKLRGINAPPARLPDVESTAKR